MEWQDWIQYWPFAVLMIVVASWVLYRFVAPQGWREWAGAGLVQGFIIALYAEMYGFPLTIYFLTSFLAIEIPAVHSSGHLWATLLGYGPMGAIVEMLIGYVFVVAGVAMLALGWRQVYLASREGRLATGGLYGLVRHPQYTGIFLAIFGQLVHWPTIPTLILSPLIVWVYVRLAQREEARMLDVFGDQYRAYQKRVPMFIPKLHVLWRHLQAA